MLHIPLKSKKKKPLGIVEKCNRPGHLDPNWSTSMGIYKKCKFIRAGQDEPQQDEPAD